MANQNVFDMVMNAVEEYAVYVKKHDVSKHTYQQLRGLFYNCLRRQVGFKTGRRPELRVDDLICNFSPSGELESYSIPRTLRYGINNWEQWDPHPGTPCGCLQNQGHWSNPETT